jgi:hypothetical protein
MIPERELFHGPVPGRIYKQIVLLLATKFATRRTSVRVGAMQ